MLFENGIMASAEDMSTESRSAIIEAAIMESCTADEISDFVSDPDATSAAVTESVLLEKSIVRLDKKARLQGYYKAAIFTIAKEKNDRDFKKLLTVWKSERLLEARLEKKYGNQAMVRAKQAMKDARKANIPVINKIAKKPMDKPVKK
jgi:hypothetical protein